MIDSITEKLRIFDEPIVETSTLPIAEEEAEKTACASRPLLESQGYCLWKCQVLRGETIAIINNHFDRLVELPRTRYPVYLLNELERMESLPDHTLRLIHLVKKLAGGATVTSVIKTNRDSLI